MDLFFQHVFFPSLKVFYAITLARVSMQMIIIFKVTNPPSSQEMTNY
jgi:hypothetical protein